MRSWSKKLEVTVFTNAKILILKLITTPLPKAVDVR